MKTFPDLIDKLGGPAAVARAAKEEPGTGRQWKARKNIPPAYWPAVMKLAEQRGIDGVTLEFLAKLAVGIATQRAA